MARAAKKPPPLEYVLDSDRLMRLVDKAETATNTAAVKRLIKFIRKELL